GVVIDSLNGRYVSGALLRIEPGSFVAATDSLGKFKVDSLAPGMYRVGVSHPLLDTLGITLVTQPIRVGPDSVTFAILAVPSATTTSSCWREPYFFQLLLWRRRQDDRTSPAW